MKLTLFKSLLADAELKLEEFEIDGDDEYWTEQFEEHLADQVPEDFSLRQKYSHFSSEAKAEEAKAEFIKGADIKEDPKYITLQAEVEHLKKQISQESQMKKLLLILTVTGMCFFNCKQIDDIKEEFRPATNESEVPCIKNHVKTLELDSNRWCFLGDAMDSSLFYVDASSIEKVGKDTVSLFFKILHNDNNNWDLIKWTLNCRTDRYLEEQTSKYYTRTDIQPYYNESGYQVRSVIPNTMGEALREFVCKQGSKK